MAKKRSKKPSELYPSVPGKCAVCDAPMPSGRRRYCSDACQQHANVAANPSYARKLVRRRDRGVCAICGIDTRRFRRKLPADSPLAALLIERFPPDLWTRVRDWIYIRRSLWEADHVTPVCEGGLYCGLDGYRTLCVPCHRNETAKLAKRRRKS